MKVVDFIKNNGALVAGAVATGLGLLGIGYLLGGDKEEPKREAPAEQTVEMVQDENGTFTAAE